MSRARQALLERAPTIKAALIFLALLLIIVIPTIPLANAFETVTSSLCFFSAAILVFWKPRLGYSLGLAGALITVSSLARSEWSQGAHDNLDVCDGRAELGRVPDIRSHQGLRRGIGNRRELLLSDPFAAVTLAPWRPGSMPPHLARHCREFRSFLYLGSPRRDTLHDSIVPQERAWHLHCPPRPKERSSYPTDRSGPYS
jgi:hypothetical protein